MNIIQVLDVAKLNPKKDFAVLENGNTITYDNLVTCIGKLSVFFNGLGLKPNDKILVSTTDIQSLVELTIGAYRFGLTVVLLDNNAKLIRAQSIIKSCKPHAFFVDSNLKTAWEITKPNCIEIHRDSQAKKKLLQKVFAKKIVETANQTNSSTYPNCLQTLPTTPMYPDTIDPKSIAYIMYTSGSTSDPKGVAISHYNLFSHLETLQKVYEMNDTSAILNVLNLYHADGINQGPLLALYSGSTWFCPFRLDTSKLDLIYYAIYKYKITHLFVVPTLLSFFEKYHEDFEDSFQTNDFKYVISVAAQLEERLWHSVSNLFKIQILNVYGLTETVNGGLFCGPGQDSFKIGTIGKPVDCTIKIINDNGNPAGTNEKGELLISGNHIMVEYFDNPIATNEVLQDGWLYTGDIAQQDEEGFVRIVGRKKSMINSGGFRIQPEEIEEIILKTTEVDACKVIGIYDAILTEKIIACIQIKKNSTLNEVVLYKYLRENLEQEKVPHNIYFLEDLPRGISGKVQVDALKNIILEKFQKTTEKGSATLETIMQTAAITFKIDRKDINELSSSSTLSGWDSLNNLIFITEIEELFQIQFSTKEIISMTSIRSIQAMVAKKIIR
jgi:long-chain acyl-CoA synthetase